MRTRPKTTALAAVGITLCLLLAVPAIADSQARIVRLSDVAGKVQIERNSERGSENAFLNMPLTEGNKLKTASDARAEIEFEDGSTIRMAPGTVIELPQLSLRTSGARVSTVVVQEGTAYVNYGSAKNDEFTVKFARESVALSGPAHFRVRMNDADAEVAVFKGELHVQGDSGDVALAKKQSATFDLANQDKYTVAGNVEADPFDQWDKQENQYRDRYSNGNSYASNGYYSSNAYGQTDLNYYGSYMNVPGYGTMWQPYFTGVGWDPFQNGAWMWYPGFGYTWVSGYPWGWTPYRSGSWMYLPTYGWLWQPGVTGTGFLTMPKIVNPPARFVAPQPPATPGKTLVVGPVVPVAPVSAGTVAIRQGSAGLGIPRGSIANLGKVQQQVERDGFVSARIKAAPVPVASAPTAVGTKAAATPRPAPARTVTPMPRSTPRATPRATSSPRATSPH